MSYETNIIFGMWMRVWIAFTPAPQVLFTQRKRQRFILQAGGFDVQSQAVVLSHTPEGPDSAVPGGEVQL